MASVVDICNSALNQLGASTIIALTENSKNGRLCNARYNVIRDVAFRAHPWNCAIKRQNLAEDTVTLPGVLQDNLLYQVIVYEF